MAAGRIALPQAINHMFRPLTNPRHRSRAMGVKFHEAIQTQCHRNNHSRRLLSLKGHMNITMTIVSLPLSDHHPSPNTRVLHRKPLTSNNHFLPYRILPRSLQDRRTLHQRRLRHRFHRPEMPFLPIHLPQQHHRATPINTQYLRLHNPGRLIVRLPPTIHYLHYQGIPRMGIRTCILLLLTTLKFSRLLSG